MAFSYSAHFLMAETIRQENCDGMFVLYGHDSLNTEALVKFLYQEFVMRMHEMLHPFLMRDELIE